MRFNFRFYYIYEYFRRNQKATSSTVTPEIANYRAKAAEWVAVNQGKYKRPMAPHVQIYRYIY